MATVPDADLPKPMFPLPHPPRSTSPPPPPRKNALGLPPTYLKHLRALLHQWLEQQVVEDAGLPLARERPLRRLWNDERLEQLERALWQGAILPQKRKDDARTSRPGQETAKTLLEVDWNTWILGAMQRRKAWKKEVEAKGDHEEVTAVPPGPTTRSKEKPNGSSGDMGSLFTRSRSVPGTPIAPLGASTANTPVTGPTRPPSVASSSRSTTKADEAVTGSQDERDRPQAVANEYQAEERMREWVEAIARMPGYRKLALPKGEDWEVINDEYPSLPSLHRDLPGAFPQSSHYDHHRLEPARTPSSAAESLSVDAQPHSETLGTAIPMVKPVFCLHFPPVTAHALSRSGTARSNSTLRLSRIMSAGAETGTSARGWWASGGHPSSGLDSGRNWSELTAHPEGTPLEVQFVLGQFALPTSPTSLQRQSSISKPKTPKRRNSDASNSSVASESDVDASLGGEAPPSSTWSGTQKADSSVRRRQEALNIVIGGEASDWPCQEGEVMLVGGTVVIRGMESDAEREAIEKVLKVLLYTIQSMSLELELLDAFRIPREADPKPSPPQAELTSNITSSSLSQLTALQRGGSHKEKGDRTKGFFQRIGKESRGVWDGLLGKRHRRPSGTDEASSVAKISEHLQSPTKPVVTGDNASLSDPSLPRGSPKLTELFSGTPQMGHSTDRYLAMLSKLERSILSTTPGLVIPPPAILLRLKEEDHTRREKGKEHSQADVMSPVPSGTCTPTHIGLTPAPNRPSMYRLGGDVRVGLGAIVAHPDSFEGWARLQRLEVLAGTAVDDPHPASPTKDILVTCQRPKPLLLTFYDNDRAWTIREYLDEVGAEVKDDLSACNRAGCVATAWDHRRVLYHSGKRVVLAIEEIKGDDADNILDVWMTCATCGKGSKPRALSKVAQLHSWSKLLELLLYTHLLVPPNLCSHAATSAHCYLQTGALVVILTVTACEINDVRLPKLQVGPEVTRRKTGRAAVEASVASLIKADEVDEVREELRNQVKVFFAEVEKRAGSLVEQMPTTDTAQKEAPSTSVENGFETQTSPNPGWFTELKQLETGLYDCISTTEPSQINDARRAFTATAKSISLKLAASEKQSGEDASKDDLDPFLPDFMKEKTHALPGSHVLIREDEPSSIIAYTLSSLAYFSELSATSKSNEEESAIVPKFAKSDVPQGETWVVEVKRRDAPRDLLNLRSVAKKRSDASIAPGRPPAMALTPNAPSLELSLEQVEGKSQTGDRLGDLVKTISKATAQDPILTTVTKSPSFSDTEKATLSPSYRSPTRVSRRITNESGLAPPSAFRQAASRSVSGQGPTSVVVSSATTASSKDTPGKEGWGSVTSSFASSFNQLMKLGTDVSESLGSLRSKGADRSLASLIGPLAMKSGLDHSLSSSTQDPLPHLQFNYSLGEKLRLGCTVYYASAFDSLRRRCAIDKVIVASLSRTTTWDTSGGKSKAAFFMTRDKRFVVKELVSKWNVSDTHALLEIAPSYFEHLEKTHNRATSLAKIVGFYSVRIHDVQTSTKRAMDLLVMENLFYQQDISRTYDLKGIEGRKVPKPAVGSTTTGPVAAGSTAVLGEGSKASAGTLFDGEWLEGMSRKPVLLHPHAKRILTEALSLDTRFLSSQSIMDYSLLVGLDTARAELVAGLVDAIGSYNLFKSFESRGKMALNRGGEVTIIPPDQYKERFESALKQYFLACPDKWSKSAASRHRSTGLPAII